MYTVMLKDLSKVHVTPMKISPGSILILSVLETQIAEFANSVDLDEVAHHEPPHLDLKWLPSSL